MSLVEQPLANWVLTCQVSSVRALTADIFLMRLQGSEIARNALPGQFVNIKVNNEFVPLLRKPFSICRRDREAGWFEVLWKVVGKGTGIMSRMRSGDSVDIIGPLGKGYKQPGDLQMALLVGGGLGVAPLPFLCETLLENKELNVEIFAGVRSGKEVPMLEIFRQFDVPIHVATEDGSLGHRGFVTEPVRTRLMELSGNEPGHLFSCGPHGFLNAMMQLTEDSNVEGQIAIETMMGCGFGICVGCPVRVRDPGLSDKKYQLTCVDGPVFDARKIILDD